MRARRILNIGAFDPVDLNRLQTAFESAWTVLMSTVNEAEVEQSRTTLATIIVSAGNVSGLDAGELAAMAIRTFEAIRADEDARLL